jgi:hypothetical protein
VNMAKQTRADDMPASRARIAPTCARSAATRGIQPEWAGIQLGHFTSRARLNPRVASIGGARPQRRVISRAPEGGHYR